MRGTLTNAETGEGLEFASIVLRAGDPGVTAGCMATTDGRFQLDPVPAGSYTLEALHLGFEKIEEELRLSEGDTLALQLSTKPVVVRQFDAFTVTGSQILVEVKEASTAFSIGLASTLPEDCVGRQAGVVSKNGQLYVRGGRSGEVSLRVDGRLAGDPVGGAIAADALVVVERSSGTRGGWRWEGPCGLLARSGEEERIPLPLLRTEVDARITGFVASVGVRQVYGNPFGEVIEALYVFPLPHDAAVHDFLMVIGERRVLGIVREREEAERIYQQARQRGVAAALLRQERPNVFTQMVANIAPGDSIAVSLRFFSPLAHRDGWLEFVMPTEVGPRYNPPGSTDGVGAVARGGEGVSGQATEVSYLAPGEDGGHRLSLAVELDAGVPVEEIHCPSHAIDILRRGPTTASLRLSPHDRLPDKDFVLRFRVPDGRLEGGMLTHRDGRGGYFSLVLHPPAEWPVGSRRPMEMVFVLDRSGSMRDVPLGIARDLLERILRGLDPGDRFHLSVFSDGLECLEAGLLPADPENVVRAVRYLETIEGTGGTNMLPALKAALQLPREGSRSRIVTLITDAYVGNEDQILALLQRERGEAQLFVFGIGSSPNRYLLEELARHGCGAAAFVAPREGTAQEVERYYERLSRLAFMDVTIDWKGARVYELYPPQLGNLLAGRPLLVSGRYEGELPPTLRVRGRLGPGGELRSYSVPVAAEAERPALVQLWARRRIQALADELRVEDSPEVRDRLRETALAYHLVSPLTSFVAVDDSLVEGGGDPTRVPVALPVPDGVRYDTTVQRKGR